MIKSDINKILLYVLAGIGGIILLGTLIGFLSGKASFTTYRHSDPSDVSEVSDVTDKTRSFKEIGKIRALVKPDDESSAGINLVINPWFLYEENDVSFKEELSYKKQAFITVILNYFGTKTKSELKSAGENRIKEDLLELINEKLEMGKIKQIFFEDYIFLE